MSISAKITSLTSPNKISVGQDVYDGFHQPIKNKFIEVKYKLGTWKYANRQTGQLYKIYTLQD